MRASRSPLTWRASLSDQAPPRAIRSPTMKVALVFLLVALAMTFLPTATASDEDEAKRAAVALVWENVYGQYGKVWATLHPRYQRVTTRAFWESCKRKYAARHARIEWLSVKATDAYPDRVTLPLLGTIRVTAVTLLAKINERYPYASGTFIDTHLWVKVGSQWKGLWTTEQYRAYKARRCPAT